MAASIEQQKLDLTEAEFALLLQACARGNASWDRVQALLKRMSRELTRLQPETLAAAEQYFRFVMPYRPVTWHACRHAYLKLVGQLAVLIQYSICSYS